MASNLTYDPGIIVSKLAGGDESAFRELHQQFYAPLTYFAFQLTKHMPQAEDIASVALMKLWNKHADFPHIGAVQNFLYTTAKNAAINYLQSQNVRQKADPWLQQQAAEVDDFDDQLVAWEIEAELLRQVYAAIEILPVKTRTIFEMLYFEGMTTEAIATKLAIPAQTVRNNKTRALDHLRMELVRRNINPIWLAIFFSAHSG